MVEEGDKTHTSIEFGPPKFQTVIPKSARRSLGIEDLDDDEKVIADIEITVNRIKKSD